MEGFITTLIVSWVSAPFNDQMWSSWHLQPAAAHKPCASGPSISSAHLCTSLRISVRSSIFVRLRTRQGCIREWHAKGLLQPGWPYVAQPILCRWRSYGQSYLLNCSWIRLSRTAAGVHPAKNAALSCARTSRDVALACSAPLQATLHMLQIGTYINGTYILCGVHPWYAGSVLVLFARCCGTLAALASLNARRVVKISCCSAFHITCVCIRYNEHIALNLRRCVVCSGGSLWTQHMNRASACFGEDAPIFHESSGSS